MYTISYICFQLDFGYVIKNMDLSKKQVVNLFLAADNCMKKMDIAQRKEKVKQDSTFRGLMREKNINLDEKGKKLLNLII